MANTYILTAQPNFTANYNLLAICNTHASAVVKIRRIRMLNHQVNAVTGVAAFGELRLYTGVSLSGQSNVAPVKADSGNPAVDAAILLGYGGTPSGTPVVLRRYVWSTDEAVSTSLTVDEYQTIDTWMTIWDVGFGDSNVQKLTLRQNEMVSLYNLAGATGAVTVWISFTVE